jgi:hypothetical protein
LDSAANTTRAALDASMVNLPGVVLTPVFAGGRFGRRAFPSALEEGVDRTAKAGLAIIASSRALIERSERLCDTNIPTLSGFYAFSIGSGVENACKLGLVTGGVATAAL